MTQHTRGEFYIHSTDGADYRIGTDDPELGMLFIATMDEGAREANAEFIVRCVNSHQDLIDALTELEAWIHLELKGETPTISPARMKARAALAKSLPSVTKG